MFTMHSFRDYFFSFWQSLRVLVQHHLTFVLCDRCDILPDSEPPFCQHCKQYGFDCTFFLPIAETRFKKKKLEEEAAAHASAEKGSLERRQSSTPHGEGSSRQADARICGMPWTRLLCRLHLFLISRRCRSDFGGTPAAF